MCADNNDVLELFVYARFSIKIFLNMLAPNGRQDQKLFNILMNTSRISRLCILKITSLFSEVIDSSKELPSTQHVFHFYRLTDVDECQLRVVCPNGDCLNTVGSYMCTCKPGYAPDATLTSCIRKSSSLQLQWFPLFDTSIATSGCIFIISVCKSGSVFR